MFKDKNAVIGFSLMGMLMVAYFMITTKQSREAQQIKERKEFVADSIKRASLPIINATDSLKFVKDSIDREKGKEVANAGSFGKYITGTEQLTTINNGLTTIVFSNKGARPKQVLLNNYKNYNNQPVQLLGDSEDKFGYNINSGINTSSLFFNLISNTKNADGGSTVVYEMKDSSGKSLIHEYVVAANSYVINLNIKGANQLVTNNKMALENNVMVLQQDNDKAYESQSSQFVYLKDGDYDYYDVASSKNLTIEKPVKWYGYKQRFFNSTLLCINADMSNVNIDVLHQPDSSKKMYYAKTNAIVPVPANGTVALQFFIGPNNYNLLNDFGHETKNIVQLHSKPFGFVKWINRGVIMPVFDYLLKHIGSVGLAIALLTLVIRLLLIPLTFSSYKSGAKMKALKPDIDKLKEKFKDDKQGFAVEQMKLFKQAGASPMSGCLPQLVQIPIFFALFALFTSHIGVRGESFLWAKDLSMYDSFIKFGVNIPLLGNHISLFAVFACITSFLISWYNMSMTPDQDNPMLKYMPYFFPIIMLFIFNKLPSALTWYYTVSNVVTLLIQFVIQKYVINPDKIKAQIEESKKKVKPKSKFQERYEQMLETQKKQQKA